MYNKGIISTLFIAATCIGGGTIALPMILAKIGVIPSLIIMIAMWLLNYYPSLAIVELNLRSERGLSLGELGKTFSGRGAQITGEMIVKLISYAALTMYLCGCSSIVHELLAEYFNYNLSIVGIETIIAIFGSLLLLFPFKIVSSLNNTLFIGLIVILFVLIGATISSVNYHEIPWIVRSSISDLLSVCPVIFAAYGYQLILHSIRSYCGKEPVVLKKSVFFGSLIPTLIYIVWSSSSLSVIFKSNFDFFIKISTENIGVGEFVSELAKVSSIPNFQILVWCMSILAIFTSLIGVGLGLAESINVTLEKYTDSQIIRKIFASVITIIPAYVIAMKFPNAFVKILGFAGALSIIMSILLPIYLLFKNGTHKLNYKELQKTPLTLCFTMGLIIIMIEFFTNN